jgi:hypothetical protein
VTHLYFGLLVLLVPAALAVTILVLIYAAIGRSGPPEGAIVKWSPRSRRRR